MTDNTETTPRQSISAGRDTLQGTLQGTPGSHVHDAGTVGDTTELNACEKTPAHTAAQTINLATQDKVTLEKLNSQVQAGNPGDNDDPYAKLGPDEAAILRRQVVTPDVKVGLQSLYRYATTVDLLLLLLGAICAIIGGIILPLMTIVFGTLQGTFAGSFNGTISQDQFDAEMARLVLYFVYLGVAMFVTIYVSTVVFIYTGEHIAGKIRERYLESCLRQNIVSPYISLPQDLWNFMGSIRRSVCSLS